MPATPAPSPRRDSKWFILALGFLILNGWAVFKWTAGPGRAPEMEAPPSAAAAAQATLLRCNGVALGSYDNRARYAILRADFSEPVASVRVARYLEAFRTSAGTNQPVSADVVGDIRSRTILVKVQGVDPGDALTVVFGKGLPSASGKVALPLSQTATVSISNGFEPRSVSTECPAFEAPSAMVDFGKEVDVASAEGRVSITPAVTFSLEPEYVGFKINGEFQPGQTYTLVFRKGIKAEDGSVLEKEVSRVAAFGDRGVALSFASSGTYLSPRGALNVPVTTMNLKHCVVSLRRICPENLVFFANGHDRYGYGRYDRHEGLTEPALSNAVALPESPNRENKFYIDLHRLAGADPRGAYYLSAEYRDPEAEEYDRDRVANQLVVVTDLGLTAKHARDGVWVWVNSLRSATPLEHVGVVVHARNNQVLARGSTDHDGLVFLPLVPHPAAEQVPALVTATLDSDCSYVSLADPVRPATEGAAYAENGLPEAFVFTDRGVYRPGETLHAKAVVRLADLTAPAPFPVLFRIMRPDGKVFRDLPATLSDLGTAGVSVELPAYLPTGPYGVSVVMPGTFKELGTLAVAVEDFVPPQIVVAISNLPVRAAANGPLPVSVSARHLFGRAAAGLPVTVDTHLEDQPFKPADWPDYSFGDAEKVAVKKDLALGQALLDDAGQQSFQLSPTGALRPAATVKATLCATVRDSGGRPVSAYASTTLDAYPFYIGLKTLKESGHAKIGEPLRLEILTVCPDGVVTAAPPLTVTVEHAEWVSAMRRQDGHLTWQSTRTKTRLGNPATVSLRDGHGEFLFTPNRAGETVVTLTDPVSGASSSRLFYTAAGDDSWVDWAHDQPASIQLSLDRLSYAPGDTARLAIRAPFTGPALLTVESDRVLEHRLIDLKANASEVEIAVQESYVPNVHCVLSLVRPAVAESTWSAHRAIGSVPLKVVPPGHAAAVTIETPALVCPQSKLPVTVQVRGGEGRPLAQAEVVVMAVDEGICMLTECPVPDPLDYFLRLRAPAVSLHDLYNDLMPVCEDTSDATISHPGGGGGELLGRRLNPIKANRFKPVALWVEGLSTGTDGVARTAFDVPEFTGELRVTAVACGRSTLGAAKHPVTVKRPLVVQAGLPRFLAPEDTCQLTLALFNEMGADAVANWKITCEGPLSVRPDRGQIALAKGASPHLPVQVTAGGVPGLARCTVEVEAGEEHYRETFELAVRPVSVAESRLDFGTVKPGDVLKIAPPAEWLPGTEFLDVSVSTRPDVQFQGSLEWLLRYPYGCCEQTTSASFPLLYLSDLATRVRPGGLGDCDVSQWVTAGIIRLLTMQRESGGFAMWPDSRQEEPWAAIYATHFLVAAKKAGYPLPEDRLPAALGYLRDQLSRAGKPGAASVDERPFICQVLAEAGCPERSWTARLVDQAGELSVSARAHLAAALLAEGKPREGAKLLETIGTPDAGEGGASRTLVLAILLSAWLDVDSTNDEVLRLVHELEGLRVLNHGGWGTTQDNAMALMALGKFSRLTWPDKKPYSGTITPAGAAPMAFDSSAEKRWTSSRPGLVHELVVTNSGPGPCWVGARLEGVPARATLHEVDQGMSIRRSFLDAKGDPMVVSNLVQGSLVVVKLELDTKGETLDNLVVEDLLPAGWEVENPELATARTLSWVKAETDWCVHRELRDDRVLLFTGSLSGTAEYYYTVRAVTPGTFALPPVRVEAMYNPELLSLSGAGVVSVRE